MTSYNYILAISGLLSSQSCTRGFLENGVGCIRVKVPVHWCVGRNILNEHTAFICPTWTTFKMDAVGSSSEILVS